jgi:putative ABC transport system permease protein
LTLRGIALKNLRRRKARAAFLVVGMLVGIATVVALLTLTQALTTQAQDEMDKYGANILIAPKTDSVALNYGGVDIGGVAVGARDIPEADVARIRTIKNDETLATVSPVLLGATKANGRQVLLMGARPKPLFELKSWWTVDGRPLANDGEAVVGSRAAKALGVRMGDPLRVGGQQLTVTGLLRQTGSQDDDLVITTLPVAQDILDRPGRITLVEVAAVCSACPVNTVVDQIAASIPGTRVTAMQQVVESRMHALDQFRTLGYAMAGVVIAIETLVVFITMMGSVSARTREIGVFRAIGFRRTHVIVLVLAEAILASLLAGVLGYLVGMGAAYIAVPLVGDGTTHISWSPLVGGIALALALLVGSIASIYPALRASRMDPTEALRAL